ncbi:ComEC/Rec2 family competence protein [Flavobacterium sp. K5-23]|uniref:ComEC/Rec2 family competence protein n=1 Tax=Flavobacterium sp. K5-23 TaxID=2746225 RepID=UPI00200CFFA7|nr:ComEC/Rec2 family competence protein [Flavobacterium sp. K5-23]UQD55911.1 ComEC/Rec2 family competence protein [Flavobacterium sp. K5-23]
MKVLQFPLARITIAFVLGILFSFYLKPNPTFVLVLLSLSSIAFGLSYLFVRKKTNKTSLFGISTYILAFIIGSFTQIAHTDYYQKSNYTHCETIFEKPHLISVTIREQLKSTLYNDRYIAIVNYIDKQEQSGRILLNIPKSSSNKRIKTGTQLHINEILHKNNPPNNPNQFDYGKYLEKKQIYGQLYADYNEIIIESELKKDIWYYASGIRTRITHNLEKSGFNKTELNVAIALIMGQKQDVSSEIMQDYQYAGAIHILSVSGLHVGFILLFLNFILQPIPNTRKGSFIKLSMILASLSLFGLVAGLAPSVVRSVTMFSFVAIGSHLRKSVNIYHTLLVSILLILLIQPSFLFDVGFQLSYIAVFFIVWLQPLLSEIWKPKNIVLKYIWGILTVSFAAQIGTLPICLFYFHQFPGLFFVTNLIVIPLLSLIMIFGVVIMGLAAFGTVPLLIIKPLEWSIFFLNKIINTIASFEQFIIKDIPFNNYLLISFYLLIFTVTIWFKKPSYYKLGAILISILFIQSSFINNKWKIEKQEELIVFNSKRNTIIVERKADNVKLISSDTIIKTSKKNNTLNSYLVGNFSSIKATQRLENLLFFKGNKILIIDSLCVYPKDINPDVLLITQSPRINIDRLLETVKPKIVVADATNFKYIQEKWKASCDKQKIPFHATGEKGFYKLN